MKRGDIYYITKSYTEAGSEQHAGRPAIIVSNNTCNAVSPTVEVVYLTTQTKTDLPTHVDIRSTPKSSIALCEQINTVFVDRIGDYMCSCTDYEMLMVDAALAISLGLNFDTPKKTTVAFANDVESRSTYTVAPPAPSSQQLVDTVKLAAERDTYKELYEKLLNKLLDN